MSAKSAIGWTDATWPIVAGCTYESPGCSNCWAVRDSWRLAHNPHAKVRAAFDGVVRKTDDGKLVWTGVVRPIPERLAWPLQWTLPRRVFVCSQSDLFHDLVPDAFIDQTFAVMALATRHTFQVLTKHPARALAYMTARGLPGRWADAAREVGDRLRVKHSAGVEEGLRGGWHTPLSNVWFGVTAEDQRRAEERVAILHQIPARVRWISAEPMLERLDVRRLLRLCAGTMGDPIDQTIDWLVCGGESAQTRVNTRPFDLDWARDLRDQCRAAGTRFFMKQLGTRPQAEDPAVPLMGQVPLAPPEGRSSRYKWHEPERWPADLRVQEFPQ